MEHSYIQSDPETDKKTDLSSALPNEILVKIFCHLHIHDVINLKLVCKRWHSVYRSDTLWGKFVPKYPGIDLPKAKSQEDIFRKLWSGSVRIGEERWFPNPLPGLVEYNTSLRNHNEERIPQRIGEPFSWSKCVLFLRLNPLYPFTTGGMKDDDLPIMLEIVNKISDKFGNIGRLGYESDEEFGAHDATAINSSFFADKQFAMKLVVHYCLDSVAFSQLVLWGTNPQKLDKEGRILGGKLSKDDQQVGDAFDDESDVSAKHMGVQDGGCLSERLFNQIRNIVIDKNERFVLYCVKDSSQGDGSPYARQILISDTAVVHCARRTYETRRV